MLKFTSTALRQDSKGILKPDENGYYTFILGGLNTYNSAGEYYVAEKAVELFKNSSSLMRRISNGALYSELGHPKKQPGMSLEDFYRRVLTIDENNICGHISEVWLDTEYGKKNPDLNNPDLIAIIGKIKPFGTKANFLKDALENSKQNIAFSVRGLTDNLNRNGRVERILTEIVTWDCVLEPGIKIANKWNSPVLEDLSDTIVVKEKLLKVAKEELNNKFANENTKDMLKNLVKVFDVKPNNKLASW